MMAVLTVEEKKSYELMFQKFLKDLPKDNYAVQLTITENEFSVAVATQKEEAEQETQ